MDGAELVLFMLKLDVVCFDADFAFVAGAACCVDGLCLFWRTARRLAGGCGGAACVSEGFVCSFLLASGMIGDLS